MGKIDSSFRSEITRLAKREVRSSFLPLKREVRRMSTMLSGLSKGIVSWNRLAKDLRLEEAKPKLEATPEEVKASRISAERIRSLRRKLGISQRELGILTGTSLGAVLSWEKGKFKPRADKKAALVAIRKLKKREVKKLLAQSYKEPKKRKPESKFARKGRSRKTGKRAAKQGKQRRTR